MPEDSLTRPLPSEQEQRDFYQKLRTKVESWAGKTKLTGKLVPYILLAPDLFHLLTKLILDSRIDTKNKTLIGSGILYFFVPLDFLPEILVGPGGFLDDVVVAIFIVNALLNNFPKEIIEEHWAGDEDLLHTLQNLSDQGSRFASKIPAGRLAKRFMKQK